MKGCNPAFTSGAGREVSLNQKEKNLLDEKGKRRYQSIVGATMYFAQVSGHDILYAVNKLTRGTFKPSKARVGAVKHVLRCFAGFTDFFITHMQGEFKLAAFSDATWRNNPGNAKSTSSYIVMLANGPISF